MTDLIVVTGLSGAGKSTVALCLEDLGYFCVDNLPPQLVPTLLSILAQSGSDDVRGESAQRLALIMDARRPRFLDHLVPTLETLKANGTPFRLVFLEASDRVLIGRYKATRRNHPLATTRTLAQAIALERTLTEPVRALANDIVDTSEFTAAELRETIYRRLGDATTGRQLSIVVQSFGFKHGLPFDCDNVMDVRFLPNPYYESELSSLSGLDEAVRAFVFKSSDARCFVERQKRFYRWLLPHYVREGKVRLSIGVGCTGGRHRSVAVAEALAAYIKTLGYRVIVDHRDIARDRA